jgi:hypothetical protein
MRKAVLIVWFIAGLNFLVFAAISMYLRGDALNGKIEGGRYYLGGSGFGLTEVSQGVWQYSRCHAIAMIVTHATALVAGAILVIAQVLGRLDQTHASPTA